MEKSEHSEMRAFAGAGKVSHAEELILPEFQISISHSHWLTITQKLDTSGHFLLHKKLDPTIQNMSAPKEQRPLPKLIDILQFH